MGDEYISMPVPLDRVQEVYELLARPKVVASGDVDEPAGGQQPGTWTNEEVLRAYRESPETFKKVFQHLASNAGRDVPMTELAKALGREPRQMAGAFGAFGHRMSNRYGKKSWPFGNRWDFETNQMVYTMSQELAKVVETENR